MSNGNFYAMLNRMKLINRWGLMRNTVNENIAEHSLEVSVIAHALAIIKNTRLNGNVSPERVATLAIFHDCSEILTGDLPTPIKYYNPKIKSAYKEVETLASNKLISMLPDDMKQSYEKLFLKDESEQELWNIVKAADKLSALIKCIDEIKSGNNEFLQAKQSTEQALLKMNMPEVTIFTEEFLPSYSLSLDEFDF